MSVIFCYRFEIVYIGVDAFHWEMQNLAQRPIERWNCQQVAIGSNDLQKIHGKSVRDLIDLCCLFTIYRWIGYIVDTECLPDGVPNLHVFSQVTLPVRSTSISYLWMFMNWLLIVVIVGYSGWLQRASSHCLLLSAPMDKALAPGSHLHGIFDILLSFCLLSFFFSLCFTLLLLM